MKITPKKGTGTFLVKVGNSDDSGNTVCSYAVITFTEELKKHISLFKETILMLKSDGHSVYQMTAFDCSVKFLSEYEEEENGMVEDDDLLDNLFNTTKGGNSVVEIEPLDLSEVPLLRTECDIFKVDDFGVKFTSIVKYTDIQLYFIDKISFEQLGL